MNIMKKRFATLAATAVMAGGLAVGGAALTAAPAQAGKAGVQAACDQYGTAEPTIRQGSTGNAVRRAQCLLNLSILETNLKVDGSFGPLTTSAVRKFQRCAGIGVDGIVGPITWWHLNYWANSQDWVC